MTLDLADAPPVLGPAQPMPPRRPGSVRRTATLDVTWPSGAGEPAQVLGRSRDLLTPSDSTPAQVLTEDVLHAELRADRTIEAISAEPARAQLAQLVGARGGGKLRGLLAEALPGEVGSGTPLNQLLDDLSGVSLVSGFAFALWPDSRPADFARRAEEGGRRGPREGVCIGFSPGASALDRVTHGNYMDHLRPVAELAIRDDELGWHHVEIIAAMSMRRSRRIDVWLDGDVQVDAFFQDSSTTPSGQRVAVHEYQLFARAELSTGRLTAVEAEARVLPHVECPFAVRNVARMVGTPVEQLRTEVPQQLKGTLGCTHLNDMLRALSDVLRLAQPLVSR